MNIPDFITHYNRSEPFRSMSSLPKEELTGVLQNLNEVTTWGLGRFSDSEYLDRRMTVEEKIRREFIAKGGKPTLNHPIYFFLGRNQKFEENEKNKAYIIRLKDLPKDSVSFTYGDSMFCFNEDYRLIKGGSYLGSLSTHIYTEEELPVIFSRLDYHSESRLHIEAQLWIAPASSIVLNNI